MAVVEVQEGKKVMCCISQLPGMSEYRACSIYRTAVSLLSSSVTGHAIVPPRLISAKLHYRNNVVPCVPGMGCMTVLMLKVSSFDSILRIAEFIWFK